MGLGNNSVVGQTKANIHLYCRYKVNVANRTYCLISQTVLFENYAVEKLKLNLHLPMIDGLLVCVRCKDVNVSPSLKYLYEVGIIIHQCRLYIFRL
jgi:hypothetical protein